MNPDLTFLRGKTVTCAVSGGCDSVVLLHLLWSAKQELELDLRAAHFHHGLRTSADGDEAFVKALCKRLGIPLDVGRGNAAVYAGEHGLSVEEAARHLRYDFLLAREGLVAVAHHGDDQVETVLLNLLRGTGLKGLCAMQKQQGRIVRPLLETTREEIERYALEHGLVWRFDETNDADDALRNRLRHHVVPLLKRENPALTGTVGRMTALLQADEALLRAETEKLLKDAEKDGGYDCRVLMASPLCKRAVRLLLDDLEKPSMAHAEAVCGLMEDLRGTKKIDLPNMTVIREYDIVYIGKKTCGLPSAPVRVRPDGPGSILWGAYEIAWEEALGELLVRPRQTGDRIRLPGGTKTVKKLLIDRKIPATIRDTLPIVLLGGEIVAVGDVVSINRTIKIKERER